MIVQVQIFIDFVDVWNFAKQCGVPKNFYINKIYKQLNSDNHFGMEGVMSNTNRIVDAKYNI